MPATVVNHADEYVVLRPFSAFGEELERGSVHSAGVWKNLQPLVNTRYLAPAYSPDARDAIAYAELKRAEAAAAVEDDSTSEETPARRGPGRPRKIEG